jgi:hypothetical protein
MDDFSLIVMDRLQWENQSENGSAADVIFQRHSARMRLHDFLDDRETQTCSFRPAILAPPKSIENMLPVLRDYAASLVDDTHTTVFMYSHRNLPAWGRVGDAIFDEVPNRVSYGVAIRLYPDGSVGADKGDCPPLRDRPWRHRCNDGARDLV